MDTFVLVMCTVARIFYCLISDGHGGYGLRLLPLCFLPAPLHAPLPLKRFLECPLTVPLPLTRFSASSAPFFLRSHALVL